MDTKISRLVRVSSKAALYKDNSSVFENILLNGLKHNINKIVQGHIKYTYTLSPKSWTLRQSHKWKYCRLYWSLKEIGRNEQVSRNIEFSSYTVECTL